jgi:hypothetical protein
MCVGCSVTYSAIAAAAAALYWDESLAPDTRQWAVVKAESVTRWFTTSASGTPSITISIPADGTKAAGVSTTKATLKAI